MRRITVIETFDHAQHATEQAAHHHLDRLYSDALSKINLAMRELGHVARAEFIDAHLPDFARLLTIKNDRILDTRPTDEDD